MENSIFIWKSQGISKFVFCGNPENVYLNKLKTKSTFYFGMKTIYSSFRIFISFG